MGTRIVGVIAAALLVVLLVPGAALAEEPPAAVDCALLESTLLGIDGAIDLSSGGSVGELLSGLLSNETSFNSFNGLVVIFSGGFISFTSAPQLISTIGACGLMPLLVTLING